MNMYKKTLLVLVAILAFGTAAMSQNNIVYPYNPDVDTDGYISTIDLLELLGLYSSEFTVGEIFVDGVSLGEVMINFQQLISATSSSGTATGEFLRWNNENENWEPELVLNDLQINDMTVNEDAIFLHGVTIDGDVGVNGALAASSIVVQSNLTAVSASLQGLTVYGATGLDGSLTVTGDASIEGVLNVSTLAPLTIDNLNDEISTSYENSELSYPLRVKGAKQGVYIELEPISSGGDIDSDQNFITFANSDQQVLGRVEGNQTISNIADMIGWVMGEIGGTNEVGYIESCEWSVITQHSQAAYNNGNFLNVFVQRGQANCFPAAYSEGPVTLEGEYDACVDSDGSPSIDESGNCLNDNCWQNGKIPILYGSQSSMNFKVPKNRNVRLQLSTPNSYATSIDLDFTWSLVGPEGSDTNNCDEGECEGAEFADTEWWCDYLNETWVCVDYGEVTFTGSGDDLLDPDDDVFCQYAHQITSGLPCPSTNDAGSVSGALGTPNANDNPYLDGAGGNGAACPPIVGDIVGAVDELVCIAEWGKAIQEAIVSFFPPGNPFDCWDMLDASFNIVVTSWSLASYYLTNCASIGVAFESNGADYAEWIEKESIIESFMPGDVVGVKGGKISKSFIEADHYMVISNQPIVLGNMPNQKEDELSIRYEKVAFLGQVPVKVRGRTHAGDYVVTSGHGDGIAISIKPDNMRPLDYKRIVGVAWEENLEASEFSYSLINTAIGLNSNDVIKEIEELQAVIMNIQDVISNIDPSYKPVVFASSQTGVSNINVGHQLETILPNKPSGMSEAEAEFVSIISSAGELNDENRKQIANALDRITMEQMGISIINDYPIVYNIIVDEDYAKYLKEEVGFMMGQIHNVISNLEEEQRVGVKGKSDEEIDADGRK